MILVREFKFLRSTKPIPVQHRNCNCINYALSNRHLETTTLVASGFAALGAVGAAVATVLAIQKRSRSSMSTKNDGIELEEVMEIEKGNVFFLPLPKRRQTGSDSRLLGRIVARQHREDAIAAEVWNLRFRLRGNTSLAGLRALAKERHIAGRSKMRKPELIAALETELGLVKPEPNAEKRSMHFSAFQRRKISQADQIAAARAAAAAIAARLVSNPVQTNKEEEAFIEPVVLEEDISHFDALSFPPGLIPQLVQEQLKAQPPYTPLSPAHISSTPAPKEPVVDAYLEARLNTFYAQLADYRPGNPYSDLIDSSSKGGSIYEGAGMRTNVPLSQRSGRPPGPDGSFKGRGSGKAAGLGYGTASEDVFDSYRRMRSYTYNR